LAQSSSSSTIQPVSSSSVSTAGYVISGSTNQIVAKGTNLEPITITNVNSFNRNSWNFSSIGNINFDYVGNSVTISGRVEDWASPNTYTESISVNGETVNLTLAVVEELPENRTSISGMAGMQKLNAVVVGKTLHVNSTAPVSVEVFDMQGRTLKRFLQVNGAISLASLQNGSYIIKVGSGSMNWIRQISLR